MFRPFLVIEYFVIRHGSTAVGRLGGTVPPGTLFDHFQQISDQVRHFLIAARGGHVGLSGFVVEVNQALQSFGGNTVFEYHLQIAGSCVLLLVVYRFGATHDPDDLAVSV